MGRIQKFLLVVGLFPLLLTSCYKDFKKVRVKPFRPDLVLPVAEADSVTVMDMLFENTYVKDLVKSDQSGRVKFEYGVQVPLRSNIKLGKVQKLVFTNGVAFGLLDSKDVEILTLTIADGSQLTADKDVTLELEDGNKLVLHQGNPYSINQEKGLELKSVQDNTINCSIAITQGGVEKVKVQNKGFTVMSYLPGEASIGSCGDLLWYKGTLDPANLVVDVVKREGWCKDYKIKYWFDNFRLVRKKYTDGSEEEVPIEGGPNGLPLNKLGSSKYTATLEAGKERDSIERELGNWLNLSSSWMMKMRAGNFHYELVDAVKVDLKAGVENVLNMNLKLRLPLSGKFDALVRQFPKDASGSTTGKGVDLPDVNELLAGASPRVRARFTDEDTVKLHFYFTNATPFDIYFAVKVGAFDPFPGGAAASSIAKNSDGIGKIKLRGDATQTIADFKFVKAVGCPEVDDKGTSIKGSIRMHEVTVGIPFKEYEAARKSAQNQKVRGLLLFRTPEESKSTPRLTDYVKVRMGVELAPEVEIELTNNKEK